MPPKFASGCATGEQFPPTSPWELLSRSPKICGEDNCHALARNNLFLVDTTARSEFSVSSCRFAPVWVDVIPAREHCRSRGSLLACDSHICNAGSRKRDPRSQCPIPSPTHTRRSSALSPRRSFLPSPDPFKILSINSAFLIWSVPPRGLLSVAKHRGPGGEG